MVPAVRAREDVREEGKVTVMGDGKRFDRETLEAMTVRQLRRLARDHYGDCLGGCSTKRQIVDEIMAQQRHRLMAGGEGR